MGYGNFAVAHLANGKTVFVVGGVPDTTCQVEITEEKKSFCYARAIDMPEGLGLPQNAGAPWCYLPYETQLASKAKLVSEALTRTGKFDSAYINERLKDCVLSAKPWHYRNKIELGYHEKHLGMIDEASKEFIEVSSLNIADEKIADIPKKLAGALNYLSGTRNLGIFRIGVRYSGRTKSAELALWTRPGAFPHAHAAKVLQDAICSKEVQLSSIVRIIADTGRARKIKKLETIWGRGFWLETLHDISYKVSAPSFFQVNTQGAESLQNLVLSALKSEQERTHTQFENICDLYCGCGTFTLPLAKTGAHITGVELAGSSVQDLKSNLQHEKLDARIVCGDVMRELPCLGSFDAIVVDPPKSGLNKNVIESIIRTQAKAIVYVSCDPQTLARDARILCDAGYELASVTPVDMFPQTWHVETVCFWILN